MRSLPPTGAVLASALTTVRENVPSIGGQTVLGEKLQYRWGNHTEWNGVPKWEALCKAKPINRGPHWDPGVTQEFVTLVVGTRLDRSVA